MSNPASGLELLEGYDAIDENGDVIYGGMEDNSRKIMPVQVDLESETVTVPRGFHDGITGVRIDVEEQTVIPSDVEQEIVPSRGAVLGKVIVCPAEAAPGDLTITDASYLFYKNARADMFDVLMAACRDVTNCDNMFNGFNALSALDLSNFDVSKVTNMNMMFTGLNANSLNLDGWDTSQVKNMGYMFQSGLKGDVDLSHFNTGNVTTFMRMFRTCTALTSVNLSNWDTHSATSMEGMFSSCSTLQRLDLSSFDTSKTTNMSSMFNLCPSLSEILGFSATSKEGMSIGFPTGSSGSAYALKRLIFRTDLGDGVYAIRSAINIKYCSFERDGMVEMFNTLPDVSALGLSSSYTTITITGNPCVTDGTLTDEDRAIATSKGWTLVE